MRTVRYRELNKIIGGILAITLALISSPAISACTHDGHSAEHAATDSEHSHHATTDTTHAGHQMADSGAPTAKNNAPTAENSAPTADNNAPSADCCDAQCQCVGACSAVPAVVAALSVSTFELQHYQFDTLFSGDTQLFHTTPFRPPIQA